jgi:hypothetical protein
MTRDSRPSPAWDETRRGSVGEADRAAVRNAQSPPNSDPADIHSHRDNNASGKGIE